jgi:hypothetical protein
LTAPKRPVIVLESPSYMLPKGFFSSLFETRSFVILLAFYLDGGFLVSNSNFLAFAREGRSNIPLGASLGLTGTEKRLCF